MVSEAGVIHEKRNTWKYMGNKDNKDCWPISRLSVSIYTIIGYLQVSILSLKQVS